jgi:CubicO group peptidase (beta-lactamase class C family)
VLTTEATTERTVVSMVDGIRGWLEERLAPLLAEHEVPGAAVAVLAGDDLAEAASGVVNTATGVAATTGSVFQLASVTKLWTATLAMQLVDDGLLDLDRPVRTYLPGFRLADEHAAASVTPRHLLSHTAGFDAEVVTETTNGDDAIAAFVDEYLPTVGQLFAPGEHFSYNNSGYSLLGRVIEVLRGQPYRRVLREHLVDPLGLRNVATRADEAVLFRTSVGHHPPGADGRTRPATPWRLPDSNQPSGAMLAMSAHDLLQFARMHLRDGIAVDGTRLVSRSSIQAMREPQVAVPKLSAAEVHWGLGFHLERLGPAQRPRPVIGHDGDNIRQYAMLRIVPDRDVAFVVFCNGGNAGGLFRAVSAHLLAELAGIEAPRRPTPPAVPQPVDPHRYVGRYRAAAGGTCTVEPGGPADLWLAIEPPRAFTDFLGSTPTRSRIVRYDGDTFVTAEADGSVHQSYAFIGDAGQGTAAFIHNGRVLRRLG